MQFKPVAVMLEGANRRGIGSRGDRYKVCHYCIDTGMPRGCPAAKCTRKKVAR